MDDYTIIKIAPPTNTHTKDTMKLAQEGLDLFSVAVQDMGGKVSVMKTKWHLLELKWEKLGKWWLSDNEADLFLQSTLGPQKIERLPPS